MNSRVLFTTSTLALLILSTQALAQAVPTPLRSYLMAESASSKVNPTDASQVFILP